MRHSRLPGFVVALAVTFTAAIAQAQQVNHPTTFTGQTDLTFNANASVTGAGNAQLTPAANTNRGSFFTTVQVPVNQFTTQFDFHTLGTAGSMADGMGFCIQRVGNTAIGAAGGQLGYQGILTSVFIKFDIYSNVSTTQIYQNGADPVDAGSIDMRPAGVDMHSQHNFRVNLAYNGTTIVMSVKDLTTNAVFNQNFTIDIPTVIGGGTAFVGFTGATGGAVANQEVLNWVYSSLAAPVVTSPPTAGYNAITLNWSAVAGATSYNILRAPTTGGPYVQIANVAAPTTTYTDTTVTYPNTYFYVVQAVQGTITSLNSNEVTTTPLQPPVTATPNTGLQTNENGSSTTFTIKYNVAQGAVSRLTVTSSDITEGTVAANGLATVAVPGGFYYDVAAGTTPTIVVTVTGVDDTLVDGNIAYQIDITATNVAVPIPPVMCTNNDNDVQGITFSRTAGLVTTESGGQDSFDVTLNRQPFNNVSFTLTSSNTAEGTVVPGSLTFTNTTGAAYNPATGVGGWNVAHTVTVTGVDDTLLDFTVPYTIVTGTLTFADTNDQNAFTAAGVTGAPNVACINLDNEVPPALDHVWGNGCGLLGAEIALPWFLVLLRRRRRRT